MHSIGTLLMHSRHSSAQSIYAKEPSKHYALQALSLCTPGTPRYALYY